MLDRERTIVIEALMKEELSGGSGGLTEDGIYYKTGYAVPYGSIRKILGDLLRRDVIWMYQVQTHRAGIQPVYFVPSQEARQRERDFA